MGEILKQINQLKPIFGFVKVKKTLGGMIDYLRHPEQRNKWGGPFNNQAERQRIFQALIREIPFESIIETGTFRGTTTQFLHEKSGLPVYTVEVQPRKYGFARARFLTNRKITLACGDSRAFLRDLARKGFTTYRPVFFYLDAHWGADLPLKEELDIVFDIAPRAVVMVDDFRVPDDDGYGYDDYGNGKVLSMRYLEQSGHGGLAKFFPAASSDQETGKRRGSVVLVRDLSLIEQLDRLECLRRWVEFGDTDADGENL